MAHTGQDRYTETALKLARKEMVSANVYSKDYTGSVKAGAVKIPTRTTEVSVRDYDTTTGVAPAAGTTTYTTITIGNDKAVNEIIDNYEAAAVPDNLAADRLDSAAYSMGLAEDSDGIGVLEAEGTTSTNTTASTSSNSYEAFMTEMVALDKADVPRNKRFLIVSPDFLNVFEQNIMALAPNATSDNIIAGILGVAKGVKVYMSNNMASGTEFILGHMDWCQEIPEFTVPIAINDLTNEFIGSSAVQGRYVWEHAVTKATAVRVKTA